MLVRTRCVVLTPDVVHAGEAIGVVDVLRFRSLERIRQNVLSKAGRNPWCERERLESFRDMRSLQEVV